MVRYNELKGFYEVEKTIGCGGFAKVKLATHVATGEKVAIKIMEKAALNDNLPRVKLELRALRSLMHQHICKLYQIIETATHYFIIVEYCSGGELFDHIVEKNRLNEMESRMFFRQIVSAVAYLHSLGYAHRDLKPENILLDKDQNLKLIDFGLCAKPKGGMKSLLYTSCGSPTYAAPELVMGKQYLGPEVDVWAMGVLLFALLAGYLPFDDNNIDCLYKKILSGKYEEPSFMSLASRKIIRQMLQVDPKQRITVEELLSHEWLTLGILDPVQFNSENSKSYDEECVSIMAEYHCVTRDDMWTHLKRWKYDYNTATYLLLVARKKRGLCLKLYSAATKIPVRAKSADTINTVKTNALQDKNTLLKSASDYIDNASKQCFANECANVKIVRCKYGSPLKDTAFNKRIMNDNAALRTDEIESQKAVEVRKGQKRIRSPALESDYSPVPIKKPASGLPTPKILECKHIQLRADTPGSARRVLDSIERSFNKVRNILTPKKSAIDVPQHPVLLTSKDLINVSTTQCNDPEFVINELMKALQKKNIHCERKGFRLRGKIEPNESSHFKTCSFELEICSIPPWKQPEESQITPSKSILKNGPSSTNNNSTVYDLRRRHPKRIDDNMQGARVGIRRKRLKGDSWCYKKVCEQVLALTATELKQPAESSV